MTHIPTEIIVKIIDDVVSMESSPKALQATLSQCSLISSAFACECRHHLFSHIYAPIDPRIGNDYGKFNRLSELVQNNPALVTYIHRVTWQIKNLLPPDDGFNTDDSSETPTNPRSKIPTEDQKNHPKLPNIDRMDYELEQYESETIDTVSGRESENIYTQILQSFSQVTDEIEQHFRMADIAHLINPFIDSTLREISMTSLNLPWSEVEMEVLEKISEQSHNLKEWSLEFTDCKFSYEDYDTPYPLNNVTKLHMENVANAPVFLFTSSFPNLKEVYLSVKSVSDGPDSETGRKPSLRNGQKFEKLSRLVLGGQLDWLPCLQRAEGYDQLFPALEHFTLSYVARDTNLPNLNKVNELLHHVDKLKSIKINCIYPDSESQPDPDVATALDLKHLVHSSINTLESLSISVSLQGELQDQVYDWLHDTLKAAQSAELEVLELHFDLGSVNTSTGTGPSKMRNLANLFLSPEGKTLNISSLKELYVEVEGAAGANEAIYREAWQNLNTASKSTVCNYNFIEKSPNSTT